MKPKSSVLGAVARRVILATNEGLRIVDSVSGELLEVVESPNLGPSISATWGISGSLLVAGLGNLVVALDAVSGASWEREMPSSKPLNAYSIAMESDYLWPRPPRQSSAGPLLIDFRGGERVVALDRQTGRIIWDQPAQAVAAVAGGVVMLDRTRDNTASIAAVDSSTGAEKWQVDLASPAGYEVLVYDGDATDKVVCVPCNDGKVYGLDTLTGNKLWEWSSPYWIPGRVMCTRSFCIVPDSGSPELERG